MYSAGIWLRDKGVQTVRSDSSEGVAQARCLIQQVQDSEVVTYGDVDHHLILDFSSDCETEAPTEEQSPDEGIPEQVLRRSTRKRHQQSYYGREQSNSSKFHNEPTSFEEATTSPDSSKWREAMETEMRSLNDNDIWELVKSPAERKVVGSKWVYKVKTGADGSVECYKARLVAQGFTEKYGTDYDETICLVVRLESLHVLMAQSV